MKQININLENCYGIKKLRANFDFSDKHTYTIYASNGMMKTSFAKTFLDLSKDTTPSDLMFPLRKTSYNITKDSDITLRPDEVFVVEPMNIEFSSPRMSTLLVNKVLKKEYEQIYLKIDEYKNLFLSAIKKSSGLKIDIEKEILLAFSQQEESFLELLESIRQFVFDGQEPLYAGIKYTKIFNDKVVSFLNEESTKEKIDDYVKTYDTLINNSEYFKQGIFNHYNASTVADCMEENGFFQSGHSVILKGKSKTIEISNHEEFADLIEAEKKTILDNPDLEKSFEQIDKKMNAKKELREFREYLPKNVHIISELKNANEFKKKIWISTFKIHKNELDNLLKEYINSKKDLDRILSQARAEKTQWRKVIEIFNSRFSVPFKLDIHNYEDAILKSEAPGVDFIFYDGLDKVVVQQKNLISVLSSGEKRALYILNFIFEVQARQIAGQETLFIIDDIADSFDYKNKYAIVEYLQDISKEDNFRQIILTHNFDFFRTLYTRFVRKDYSLMVEKDHNEIRIVPSTYVEDPLESLIDNLTDNKKMIASIPFVRNLVKYSRSSKKDSSVLTSLLHIKAGSKNVTKSDIKSIYESFFKDQKFPFLDSQEKIIDLTFKTADTLLSEKSTGGINLEDKIILSIAIRLRAEEYILTKINNKKEAKRSQTSEFIRRFKDQFKDDTSQEGSIALFEQVNIMTPENIHLNSFMYEPIIDMSDDNLKSLYSLVKSLK